MKRQIPLILLVLLGVIVNVSAAELSTIDSSHHEIQAGEIWLRRADFSGGTGQSVITGEEGVTMNASATTALYTSAPLTASLPFNALVPQWKTSPSDYDHEAITFQFRTGTEDGWGEWLDLYHSDDMTLPDDEWIIGDMLVVPAEDVTHDRVQFRAFFHRDAGSPAPRLEEMRITVIDSSAGPTTEELVAQQQALPSPKQPEDGFAKPFVVSRDVWCTDPRCDYTDGLKYYPVSHLILHHTVTSSNGDSAATVRAIWYFHTVNRGWGDIGYNYLVDTGGVLFEGHLGGDDVVGTHAGDANTGSMALSLIGNFVETTPPEAMMDAAADLFAWKADQKDIDIYDSGRLPYLDWGVPKLMGHRDVYGTTQCPGNKAHALLPSLREEIASRIGFTPSQLYYDEQDPDTHFTKSGSGWMDGDYGCGFDVHSYYAWSTTDAGDEQKWAEWNPDVAIPGHYQLSVYAPYCKTGERDTNGAIYQITDPYGTHTVVVNQEANLGLWVSIGNYYFDGRSTKVRLTNLTSTDNDWGVWADAIRLQYLGPTVTTQTPAPDSWQSSRTVTFRWAATNQPSITRLHVQVATDPLMTSLMVHEVLNGSATSTTHTFSTDYTTLYWRVVAEDTDGQVIHTTPVPFGIDTVVPTSNVSDVYRFPDGRLLVTWSGTDVGSGVANYNIQYRVDGTNTWSPWLTNTAATSAFFTPPHAGATYWFRSQSTDAAGHVEPAHNGNGDTSTMETIVLNHELVLPLVRYH